MRVKSHLKEASLGLDLFQLVAFFLGLRFKVNGPVLIRVHSPTFVSSSRASGPVRARFGRVNHQVVSLSRFLRKGIPSVGCCVGASQDVVTRAWVLGQRRTILGFDIFRGVSIRVLVDVVVGEQSRVGTPFRQFAV